MKTLLAILFYNAIIAVNMAVMVSGLLRLAAIKREKEKKPNPDFTPPLTKRKHDYFMQAETDGVVRRWVNRGAAFPKDITVCGKPYMLWSINSEPDADVAEYREIKTPTTGSSAIGPKERKYDELDAVAKLLEAYHKLGNAGASTLDEIAEKFNAIGEVNAASVKEIADALDRINKKPVTPERMKEAGFETEPVSTYRPEEEIIKRYEAVQERLETARLSAEKALKEQTERFEKLKAAGPAVAPVHSCGSCYWFSEGGGGKFGLCIRNDEIADRDGQKACFDPQERRSKVRPKPLGTVTTR